MDVQGEQDVAVAPVEPVRMTRAYSRPQSVVAGSGPETGTTGGLVVKQAGTWDPKPVARPRLSDDPVVREQQSLDRAQADFEAKQRAANPFIYSGAVTELAKVGGRRYTERAIAQGERAYEDQLSLDRAAVVDQRRSEAEERLAQNETRIQQMMATGQKYRRDEYGNVQPILAPDGRPLYQPTTWKPGTHPKTKKPVLEMRDQFGQRQYKRPTIRDSGDPTDEYLYADMGDGESVPYMTKAEAAMSDDVSLKRTGLAAVKKARAAVAQERLSGYRQESDAAARDLDLARATIMANRQRAESLAATNPEEYARLTTEADELEQRAGPRGEMALRKMVADIDISTEQADLRRETRLIQRDEMAARIAARGGNPMDDPFYRQNEAALAQDEAALEQARRQRETLGRLMTPVPTTAAPAAVAPAPQATAGQKISAGASAIARGAGKGLVEGGEFIARNLVRATPTSGIFTPGGGFIPYDRQTQQAMEAAKPEQQRLIAGLATEMRTVAEEWGPRVSPEINRKLRDSWITGKIPEGIGSALSFMAPGAGMGKIGKLVGLGERGLAALATATVATSGAAVGGNSFRREAEQELQKKLDAGQITQREFESGVGAAEIFGGVLGTSEAIPISRFVQRLGGTATGRNFISEMFRRASKDGNSGVAKWLETTGGGMLAEAIEEAGQEAFQSLAQDVYAAQTFDPSREIGADAAEQAGVGGAVGALLSLATRLVGIRQRGGQPPAGPTETAPIEPVTPDGTGVAETPPPPTAEDIEFERALTSAPVEEVAASDTGITPEPSVSQPVADESAVAEFNRKLAEIPGGPETQTLQEPAVEAGSAPDTGAGVEAPVPASPVAEQPRLSQSEIDALLAIPIPNEIPQPVAPEPAVASAEIPAVKQTPEGADAPAGEAVAGRPPVSTDPGQIAADRAEYDRIQAEMRARKDYGSDEYNALWQQSEDIKNRHGGMPPGEVAGEQPVADLRKMVDDFDAGGQVTVADFADAIEGMGEDAPKWLSDVAKKYREEVEQDYTEFGGRGDAGDYTDTLERAARRYLKQTAPKAAPAPKKPKAASAKKVDVSPIANAKTEKEMVTIGGRMMREEASREGMAAIQKAMQQWSAPAESAPRTAEQRLNDAGADLPPISSLKADQKLAELHQGGIKTYAGKPIEDANPAQLSNALGKFRRGELTPDGEKSATQERTSERVIKALQKAKINKPGQITSQTPLTLAYDAALDLAIVSIRAGRAVADAVKLAVARFKARYPSATDDDVARLTAAITEAGKEPPPTDTGPGAGGPPSGQTFTGPVSPGGPEFRKRSKSALGEYEYVSTTNQGQQKYAQEFADWHEKNGTLDSAVSEMRAINEPAMRAAVGAELLARTMEQWEAASVADKPRLMARAASIMGDVKAEKTEAGQALQSQAMVNKRLAPYAGLLSWMDLLRTRYETEVAPKVGGDTGAKVKRGIKEAGEEAAGDLKAALETPEGDKPAFKNEKVAEEWVSRHSSALALLRKAAKARGLAWGDIFTGLPENQEARKQELFDRVKAEPKLKDLSDANKKRLADNLDEAWTYLRNQIFRKEFGRLVQLPNVRKADAEKVRSVVGDLIKFSNLGILDNEAFLSAVAEKYGIEKLDGPTATKLTEIAGRLQRAKNDSERARTTIEMYEAVAKAKGVSVPDVLMSGFYSNLLNSLVTTGYAMMGGNVIQSIWNLGTLAASGKRGKAGLFVPPSPKQAAQGAAAIARGYKTGIPEGLRQALSILVTGHGGEDAAAKLVEARGEPLEMVAEGGVWPEFEAKNPKAAKAVQTAANVAKMVPRLARAIDAAFYYPAKQASLRFLTEQSMLADYPDPKVRAQKAAELLKVSPSDFMAAEKKARDEGFTGLDLSLRMADILEPKSALMKIKGATETQRYLTDQQRAAQAQGIGDPLMKEGTRFAAKTTLSQEPEGWAGVFYDGFSKTVENVRPGGFPILKLLFPFLRLPTNFYNANLAATPFGAGAMAIGDTPTMQKKDGKRLRRQLTDTERGQLYMQSLIGSASMLYFALQAMQADPDDPEAFDITANGPADRTLRRQMEQAGWKPKSIRIPGTDTWVDYMNTPMAMALAIAGHIADAYKYQKTEDELVMGSALLDASVRFPSIMFGLPALSGMQDLGELLDEENVDAKKVSRFLTRSAKNFVRPRLIEEVDRIFNPTVKDDGVIRYDELGDPVERSPLSRIAKTTTTDPLRRTLLDRKLKIPAAGRETKLRNVRMTPAQVAEYAALPADQRAAYKSRVENPTMTPEQYSEYMRLSGARIKAKLTPLVPLLKALPADKAQDKIDSVTEESRREAREIIRRSALTPVSAE
jgi:hypothetical protein